MTEMAVFRPSDGIWYVHSGTSRGIPVPGDFTAAGTATKAVFRPSQGIRHVSGGSSLQYAAGGDLPIPLPSAIRSFFFP